MRGFTMIMVVLAHVMLYSFHGEEVHSFNKLFVTFRMPLFFAVSGFILYKKDVIWDVKTSVAFLWKKFKVQIVSTCIFLGVYMLCFDYSLHSVLFSCTKMGYWFTLELFQFFVLYVLSHLLLDRLGRYSSDIFLVVVIVVTQILSVKPWPITPIEIYNLLDVPFLKYFVYFYVGTLVRRNFVEFQRIIDNCNYLALVIVAYLIVCIFYFGFNIFPISLVLDIMMGFLGIVIIFTFFRKHELTFTTDKITGRILQYIGRRTLDIYFLHYFFLPRNLEMVGSFFKENSNPIIEFCSAVVIALLVIVVCLVTSNFLRLSPTLAHVLFGVSRKYSINDKK